MHVLPRLGAIVLKIPQGPCVLKRVFEQMLGAHGLIPASGGCSWGSSVGCCWGLGLFLFLLLCGGGSGSLGSRRCRLRTTGGNRVGCLLAAGSTRLRRKGEMERKYGLEWTNPSGVRRSSVYFEHRLGIGKVLHSVKVALHVGGRVWRMRFDGFSGEEILLDRR